MFVYGQDIFRLPFYYKFISPGSPGRINGFIYYFSALDMICFKVFNFKHVWLFYTACLQFIVLLVKYYCTTFLRCRVLFVD